MKGVKIASTKMELKNAKKIPPKGEAKKSKTRTPVTTVGMIASICSRGPFGSPGGSR